MSRAGPSSHFPPPPTPPDSAALIALATHLIFKFKAFQEDCNLQPAIQVCYSFCKSISYIELEISPSNYLLI